MFGIARAPEIDRPGLEWFNVDGALSLEQLKGRLVVLDFWTFCCVNCLHVLPTLARLEAAYPNEVAVIGIHSPKFDHERDPEAVRRAIARHDIAHAVAHDPHMLLWQEFCVRAWPTLVFISPDGYVIGQMSGEPHPDLLIQGVGDMVEQFWQRGEMKPGRLPTARLADPGGALRFPGKIKPCPSVDGTKMWALADTGHHQILVIEDDGTEVVRYGSGEADWRDGGVEAAFNAPEGLACDQDYIYVADTGNHRIRRIDRASGLTGTIAGIGCRGAILRDAEPGSGCALASPWDLELAGNTLFFANAGSHQIGMLELDCMIVSPVAGNGGENIVDGPAMDCMLAQPSGLALSPDGTALYFADAETSSIRKLDFSTGRVETLAGAGLFDFGHINGKLDQARLQHPLGVAAVDGKIMVADSYNSRIRIIEPGAEMVSDFPDLRCVDKFCRPQWEPAGVAADGEARLLVSDTNNHRIMELLLDEGITRTWLE